MRFLAVLDAGSSNLGAEVSRFLPVSSGPGEGRVCPLQHTFYFECVQGATGVCPQGEGAFCLRC